MIEERAIILSLNGDSNNPTATLEIERKTACGLCGQTRGCGNSIWGKLFAHQSSAFKAQNRINAKVGDSVIVGINEQALLKSALLLYMLPLATLFIGAILAMKMSNTDGATMLGAAVGLVIGLLWVKGHTISNAYFLQQQPQILRLA
jgi:sigma-E factor negative regulatory protein RseC